MLSDTYDKTTLSIRDNQPFVNIIILNWNNAGDTIECLESLRSLNYRNFVVALIDNGSTDDSIQQIRSWALGKVQVQSRYISEEQRNKKTVQLTELSAADVMHTNSSHGRGSENNFHIVLIKSGENLGFSKGSNRGISFALLQKADYIMLLNNDTWVDSESLTVLVSFLETNRKYSAATPQIRQYSNPDKTDNCGGKLVWYGARKYFFYHADVTTLPQEGSRQISFISGCAVLFRSEVFKRVGLLTEQFFHGEEDFEFSWRLKKNKIYAACCFSSVIYHKIGRTVNKAFEKNNIGKNFNYYLNRYIDMRSYFFKPYWFIWRVAYLLYIIPLLMIKYSYSIKTMFIFSKQLLKLSKKLNGVDKNLFEKLRRNEIN